MHSDEFLTKFLLFALLLAVSASAAATGSGTIVMNGKTATVAEAYAYRHTSPNDRSTTLTTIVVSDRTVDPNSWATNDDPDKALHAQLKRLRAVYWEAILNGDGTVRTTNAVWPGVLELRGSGTNSDVHVTQNNAKHIEGSYRSLDEQPKELTSGVEYFDLKFSVDF